MQQYLNLKNIKITIIIEKTTSMKDMKPPMYNLKLCTIKTEASKDGLEKNTTITYEEIAFLSYCFLRSKCLQEIQNIKYNTHVQIICLEAVSRDNRTSLMHKYTEVRKSMMDISEQNVNEEVDSFNTIGITNPVFAGCSRDKSIIGPSSIYQYASILHAQSQTIKNVQPLSA